MYINYYKMRLHSSVQAQTDLYICILPLHFLIILFFKFWVGNFPFAPSCATNIPGFRKLVITHKIVSKSCIYLTDNTLILAINASLSEQ